MAVITSAAIVAGGTALAAKKASDASKNAAKKAAEGQTNALTASSEGAAQASSSVNDLFGQATDSRNQAFSNTLDFLGGAPAAQIQPFQTGNVMAQQQIQRGLPQIQNAILGLNTDLSGFKPRMVGQADQFNVQMPQPVQQPVPTNSLADAFAGFQGLNVGNIQPNIFGGGNRFGQFNLQETR